MLIGSELEGHADNVSAALTWRGDRFLILMADEMDVIHFPEPKMGAVILVPPAALRTEESRGLLPEQLSHVEATAGSAASNVMTAAIAQWMIGKRRAG